MKPPTDAGDVRDIGLIPGLGRSSGGGNGNPFQYAYLDSPMDKGAWRAIVHRITRVSHLLSTHTHIHSL